MTFLFDLLSQGKLTAIIAKRVGLEEAAEAHALLSDTSLQGRIMLAMG
jgi:NADPH:quinone reductase-like Zn-dependent oxidoreductase